MENILKSNLATQISTELTQYFGGVVNISDGVDFSMPKLIRRISLFEAHVYPTGKFDSQGNYKFFYDIQTPRINAEIKNIDFDTKNIEAYSSRKVDELPNLIVNLKIGEWLRENGQAEEINSAIEEGAGWGNVVWKKIKGGYERVDLRNFYAINQTAKSLDESPVIERHQLSQSDLRAKSGTWEYVDEVIKGCKTDSYSSTIETTGEETTTPYYEIYERNGEVCLKDLKMEKGEKTREGDQDKYVLAKVIGAGVKSQGTGVNIKYILFADEISKMPYKEYHRSRYKGRWWREGLIELLFDLQVRANQIGNQIAQGLEWASKTIFTSSDKLIVQNILTDLKNGDIIRSQNLQHVPVRMEGFDQLANEWNRLMQLANDIANSQEVVQGITPPTGVPLGTTRLVDVNANKLFDFIREKLAIPFSEIMEEWIVPQLVKELKAEEVLRITGDSGMLERLYTLIVDGWYLENLIAIGPHTEEIGNALKAQKMDELKARPQLLVTGLEKVFADYHPNVAVIITGEQLNLDADIQTMLSFANLEIDPIRRSAILELMAKKKGLDFGSLAKSPPIQPQQQQPQAKPMAGVLAGETMV